jgi:hypothetical protein
MHDIARSSDRIAETIGVIDGIAFRTDTQCSRFPVRCWQRHVSSVIFELLRVRNEVTDEP